MASEKNSQFLCSIPLKHFDKPDKHLPENFNKFVYPLYITQYLESIGADLTPQNIAMVKKNNPLFGCNVTTAFKSKGSLNDVVYISAKNKKKTLPAVWKETGTRAMVSEMFLEQKQREDASKPAVEEAVVEKKKPVKRKPASESIIEAQRSILKATPSSFRDYRSRLLGAFEAVKQPNNAQLARARHKEGQRDLLRHQRADGGGIGDNNFPSPSRLPILSPRTHDERIENVKVEAQMRRPLELTIEDVLAVQTMFARSFPFESLADKVQEEEIVFAIAEMTSLHFAQLVRTVSAFLHATLIEGTGHTSIDAVLRRGGEVADALNPSRPPGSAPAKLQKNFTTLLVDIYEGHERMLARLRRKTHLMHLYPLMLLSMRVTIETVFRSAYPHLLTSKEAAQVIRLMNKLISFIFDPEDYHNHSSLLKLHNEPLQSVHEEHSLPARENLMDKFYSTSSLVRNLCNNASSGQTRAFLQKGKMRSSNTADFLPLYERSMAAKQKKQLYRTAFSKVRQSSSHPEVIGGPTVNDDTDVRLAELA